VSASIDIGNNIMINTTSSDDAGDVFLLCEGCTHPDSCNNCPLYKFIKEQSNTKGDEE
jgi:hypothetical protein